MINAHGTHAGFPSDTAEPLVSAIEIAEGTDP
jgi:hypothetical protein